MRLITAAISSARGITAGSIVTTATPVVRFTATLLTPAWRPTPASIAPEHVAHVIPVTLKRISSR